ncbi:hypothetical protein L7Q78_45860, partial [Achromobacter xylosoxidans]|nr:hypothetical protein [Achromobacter xylosoxidans]
MLDTSTVRALAARLHDAERSRQQIRQISLEHPDRMISPASSATSCAASLFASHTTPLAGWFKTPAATPVSSIT